MKVVLFCGGRGMRLRDYSEQVPKPMVPIGRLPVLWHLMKYYAHFGHTEFILALGYRAEAIKRFFLDYEETLTNDFVMRGSRTETELLGADIHGWTITFVDTGLDAQIGERLRRLEPHIGEDEVFLANYADGLTDLDLDEHVAQFMETDAVGTFLAVRPPQSYHVTSIDEDGYVTDIGPIASSDLWLNAGYFVFRRSIFDVIESGEDLVAEPFHRLLEARRLRANRYEGWWAPMDTFKDKQHLDSLHDGGRAPWMLWKDPAP